MGIFEPRTGRRNVKDLSSPMKPHWIQLRRAIFTKRSQYGIPSFRKELDDFLLRQSHLYSPFSHLPQKGRRHPTVKMLVSVSS